MLRAMRLSLTLAVLLTAAQRVCTASPGTFVFPLNKTEYGIWPNTTAADPLAPSWATTLELGTPPQAFQAMIDTGSGLVWLPAQGCGSNCSQGLPADAGFNAAASSTFQAVWCSDPSCNETFCQECACSASDPDNCAYSLEYMEGATAFGDWVQDRLQLPGLAVADAANATLKFGLQRGSTGDLQQQTIPALAGLNAEPTSLVSQLAAQDAIEDSFSYCFDDEGRHVLVLGVPRNESGASMDFEFMPLLLRNSSNPAMSQPMYFVELIALALEGAETVQVPKLPTGPNVSVSMAMVDSGTSLLALPPAVAQAFGEAVLAAANKAGLSLNASVTDGICFQGVTLEKAAAGLPPLTFTFGSGINVTVPSENYLAPAPGWGAPCVAVEPSSQEFPVLGAKPLQKVAVTVRNSDNTLGIRRVRHCIDLVEFQGADALATFLAKAEGTATGLSRR